MMVWKLMQLTTMTVFVRLSFSLITQMRQLLSRKPFFMAMVKPKAPVVPPVPWTKATISMGLLKQLGLKEDATEEQGMNKPHDFSSDDKVTESAAGERQLEHARRIKLLNSISTGSLATLSESMRLERASDNGKDRCSRLAAGNVDCSCNYCESFWSRLEELIAA